MARRRIPVLVGTVALLAGCGSPHRVEVSGVVRDGETGRVIAGALVVGADGSATRTDADGRFSLSVRSDDRRGIRASAEQHEDAFADFDPGTDDAMAFDLAPLLHEHARIEEDDPDAVLRWLHQSFFEESLFEAGWAADAARSTEDGAFVGRPEIGHPSIDGLRTSVDCTQCHVEQAAFVDASWTDTDAPHATLADGCLACHGRRAADGVRMRVADEADLESARCTACHAGAREARGLTRPLTLAAGRAEAAFARAVVHIEACGHTAHTARRIDGVVLLVDRRGWALGDCDASMAIDGSEIAIGLEVLSPGLAAAAQDLALLDADGSHGVHQPFFAAGLAHRIERAAIEASTAP